MNPVIVITLLITLSGILGFLICYLIIDRIIRSRDNAHFEYLQRKIDVDENTDLVFIDNYISYMDGHKSWCDLKGYLDFLRSTYQSYRNNNTYESFQEYLDRKYPPIEESEEEVEE